MADNQLTENDEDDIVIIEGEEPVQEPVQEEADDSDDEDQKISDALVSGALKHNSSQNAGMQNFSMLGH